MTKRRLSAALVVVVLLGTPWADAEAQKTTAEIEMEVARQLAAELAALRQRAEQGEASYQSLLGSLYRLGEGIPQNYTEAARWYRLAADQGYAAAQFNLGVAYGIGNGVPLDYLEAHKWLNLAAARATTRDDREQYAEARDVLAELMTPQQVDEAQRLATDWQAAFDARQE